LAARRRSLSGYTKRPWQCLYFWPEPHGHGSLRPALPMLAAASAAGAAARPPASTSFQRARAW
jgi:hypothetical protein